MTVSDLSDKIKLIFLKLCERGALACDGWKFRNSAAVVGEWVMMDPVGYQ